MSTHTCTQSDFLRDVGDHTMTVLRDDGVYRHLQFRRKDSSAYWFQLVTWPGVLCINGDMGTFVFRRLEDMFKFFRTAREYYERTGSGDVLAINPSYWSEKLHAPEPRHAMAYCADAFRRHVQDAFDDWVSHNQPDDNATQCERETFAQYTKALRDKLAEEVLSSAEEGCERAHYAARDFAFGAHGLHFAMEDSWEWDCREFTFDFLWCCYAIAWGIKQYDQTREAAQ